MIALKAPPADEILARAREIRFSRTVLIIVLWFFWLPGWAAGRTWLALVFFAVAVRRGWRDGTGWDARQAVAVSRMQDDSKV